MNLHQALILFNEYHHCLEGGYDSDVDEGEDEEQEGLFPTTEDDGDIFYFMFMAMLSLRRSRKRASTTRKVNIDPRIPRRALPSPGVSPWVQLFASNRNNAMICFTGLNYASFNYLSVMFEELYNKYTPYSRSGKIILKRRVNKFRRPRSLDSRGCLGLVLTHLRSRGSFNLLCILFGTTNTVTALSIRFGRRLLLLVLKNVPSAYVSMPSLEDIREYQRIIEEKYPTLADVWFVMDGLRLSMKKPGISDI